MQDQKPNHLALGFIDDTDEILKRMERLLTQHDYHSYLDCIHSIKGSAGSLGAEKLFNHCRKTLRQNPERINYIRDLQLMNTLFQEVESELRRYLSNETLAAPGNSCLDS